MTGPGKSRTRSGLEGLVLDEVRQHYYDARDRGSKPDDPGWHVCRCGWEGYWCDYEPHVAERITEALAESPFVSAPARNDR